VDGQWLNIFHQGSKVTCILINSRLNSLFLDAKITGITHVSAELEMIITRYNSFLGSSYAFTEL